MTARRGIIGLCMLCALAFSAIAAQSASAAPAGTTAFTCKKEATAGHQFRRAHCKEEDKTGGVASEYVYEHVPFAEGTVTEITGNNETTGGVFDEATLESTQVGINVLIHAEEVHGEGTMSNKKTAGGEHYIHGEGVIEYLKLKVTPESSGCKVKGGKVVTKQLTATTEGQEMRLKFQPKEGTAFAEFVFEGCSVEELNGNYKVTGSVKTLPIDGATLNSTLEDTTTQNTLKLRNVKAGLEGTLTIKGKDKTAGDTETTPLSATTVQTP